MKCGNESLCTSKASHLWLWKGAKTQCNGISNIVLTVAVTDDRLVCMHKVIDIFPFWYVETIKNTFNIQCLFYYQINLKIWSAMFSSTGLWHKTLRFPEEETPAYGRHQPSRPVRII